MITITLAQIRKHNPCNDGWKKLRAAYPDLEPDEPFPMTDILASNGLDDTIWAMQCLPEHDILWRKFAWWCASQVVTADTDPRVIECLATVYKYCQGEDVDLAAARAAAAWAAADATAAWAADAAAADAAAWAAAADAAAWAAQTKQLLHMLTAGDL